MSAPLLDIRGLAVEFPGAQGPVRAVRGLDLQVGAGEVVALVGESGSGKTMVGRSILRLVPSPGRIAAGSIVFEGRELLGLGMKEIRQVRGKRIAMVFQEPLTSLNPALTVGYQMAEAVRLHRGLSARETREASLEMLRRVRIRDPERCLAAYPHVFSGGMRQRIMLASVLLLRPALLIADEPTTALDAVIQKEVLDIMLTLVGELGTAVLLVSHDLGLVARYAGRVAVMRHGEILERGPVEQVMRAPAHPYSRALLEAVPKRDPERETATGARPLLRARGLCVEFAQRRRLPWQRPEPLRAVSAVDLVVGRGETVGVVGESGSGKTTLGRALLRLVPASAGTVDFDGLDVRALEGEALRRLRRRAQIVFQDPYSSLDPRLRVGAIVAEGLRHVPGLGREEREQRVARMLEDCGLGPDYARRFPHQLSGGQRQRVGIARALVAEPDFVVADEPVSALDLTVQAQILRLLRALQAKYGFSCLFISHDLGVVEQICDRVLVMHQGRVLEQGPTHAVFDRPRHPYTNRLLQAVPRLLPAGAGGGWALAERADQQAEPPPGWAFFEQTPDGEAPTLVEVEPGHAVACRRR